jgi:hypothetical protein
LEVSPGDFGFFGYELLEGSEGGFELVCVDVFLRFVEKIV